MKPHPFSLFLFLFLFIPATVAAEPTTDFQAANKAAENKDYKRALTLYRKVLKEAPTDSALWNAGLCAYLSGDGRQAAEFWESLKKSAPLDWRTRAKLVQAYTLAEDTESAERERQELLELQKTQPELFDKPSFCREQFQVGERTLLVYETFTMTPPRGLRYIFFVTKPTGEDDYRISLGSYDQTNAISHELRETPEGVRLFHLDGYYDGGKRHRTFNFYQGEPNYQTVRKRVVQIVSGKVKALSESGPAKK